MPVKHAGQKSFKQALMRSAIWAVSARWIIKLIGFLNTVIVARLVAPQDYGIVAMAFLVVGLTQSLLDFGVTNTLLRKGVIERDEIDSAWSLAVIQGVCCALVLGLLSPFAGKYFQEPRVVNVLWILSGCLVLSGFTNIGMTLAQKDLHFSLEFTYKVAVKLVGVCVTLVAVYFLHDYRALMFGVVSGYLAGVFLSYFLHPYRPKWTTSKVKELWAVSKWLMLAGIGTFFLRKTDELIAARIATTEEFGLYNVSSDLGQLPTGELGPAMLRAFLPVLSSIQDDFERTNKAVIKTLAAANAITLPVAFGFSAVAIQATDLILGERWLSAAPFVASFALVGAAQFAMSPLTTLLVLRGHTRTQNRIVWLEFAIFVLSALLLLPHFHLLGLVWSRMVASLANAVGTTISATRLCGVGFHSIVSAVSRPLVGAIVMWWLVGATGFSALEGVAGLCVNVAYGAAIYVSWTTLTWLLAGRPEGLESTIYDLLIKKWVSFGSKH